MLLETNEFYKLKGLNDTDEVTVNALQLQSFLRELDRASESEKRLEEENKVLKEKLEDCYNRNEVLHEDNMSKAGAIRSYKKQLANLNNLVASNTKLKREYNQVNEKLHSLMALKQYNSNSKITDSIKVKLNSYG